MESQQLDLLGWHFVAAPSQDGRIALTASEPDSCALQAFLDVVIPDAQGAATAIQLIRLAVGVHGQGLGYSPSAFKAEELVRDADEPAIGIYLDRAGQPYEGPYWTISFVGCPDLTLVPHPVFEQVVGWASAHRQQQMQTEANDRFADEAAREGLSRQSVTLETRAMDGFRFGIFRSGTVSYVRILNPEHAAINWLFLYMDQMVAPFNMILDAIRRRKTVSAFGIVCAPMDETGSTTEEASWIVTADWVATPSILGHADFLRILEFMVRTQILG